MKKLIAAALLLGACESTESPECLRQAHLYAEGIGGRVLSSTGGCTGAAYIYADIVTGSQQVVSVLCTPKGCSKRIER